MIARPLPARTPEEIARLVRALGSHRYVAGRLILVHAFVFEALAEASLEEVREACAWSADVLASADLDPSSRDPRLHRAATEREAASALAALWNDDETAMRARETLRARLRSIHAPIEATLFDESREEDVFPVPVDAGWELLTIAELDPERHRGALDALAAAVDDAEAASEDAPPLHELPAIGPAELLEGSAHGILRAPLVLWTAGNETYSDYVLRGVLRAAKLD